jgi:Ethanolamine utilization protein EutJ (predicted chaperonin)
MIYLVGSHRAFEEYIATNTIVNDTVEAGEIVATHIYSPEHVLGFHMTELDEIIPLHNADNRLVCAVMDKRTSDIVLSLCEKMDAMNDMFDKFDAAVSRICP